MGGRELERMEMGEGKEQGDCLARRDGARARKEGRAWKPAEQGLQRREIVHQGFLWIQLRKERWARD